MANRLIRQIGHSYLPLSVTVKENRITPDQFFVEVFIHQRFAVEEVVSDQEQALLRAQCLFNHWHELLLPVYEVGRAA
jgi:hypothetical protein